MGSSPSASVLRLAEPAANDIVAAHETMHTVPLWEAGFNGTEAAIGKKRLKGRNVILSGVCNSAGALADVAPAPNGEAMRGAPAGVSPAPNGEAMREVRFLGGGGLPERTESGTGRCVRSGCVLVGEAVRDGSPWARAGPRGGGLGNRRWPFVKKKSEEDLRRI